MWRRPCDAALRRARETEGTPMAGQRGCFIVACAGTFISDVCGFRCVRSATRQRRSSSSATTTTTSPRGASLQSVESSLDSQHRDQLAVVVGAVAQAEPALAAILRRHAARETRIPAVLLWTAHLRQRRGAECGAGTTLGVLVRRAAYRCICPLQPFSPLRRQRAPRAAGRRAVKFCESESAHPIS